MTNTAESTLPRLSRQSHGDSESGALPERILQFGKGNFLRGFVEWMVQSMNEKGLFKGNVVVVEATGRGRGEGLNAQQGLYTTILRGLRDGEVIDERQLIECVSRVLNPYEEDDWLETAHNPDLRFIVSNTTEAGIALDREDALEARPSPSFPGKLTQWLYARFSYFEGDPERAVVVLPCELIEDNGRVLRSLVLQLAAAWDLSPRFSDWLRDACVFTSTLVDRIVTGYPADAARLCAQLGYQDSFMVAGEPYHAWIIEGPQSLEEELPLQTAGLNVVWTDDVTPYRECKVRILNGAHTAMAIVGSLAGLQTVGDCMRDPAMRAFIENLLAKEISPTLALPRPQIETFTRSVLERFENPFVRHQLRSILLNSVSKFRARLLDPLEKTIVTSDSVPPRLAFALASLVALYRPSPSREPEWDDEPRVFETFGKAWNDSTLETAHHELASVVTRLLSDRSLWDQDLTLLHKGLVDRVVEDLAEIVEGRVLIKLSQLGSVES